MTFRTSADEKTSKLLASLVINANDGFLLSLGKCLATPFRYFHSLVTATAVSLLERCSERLIRTFTRNLTDPIDDKSHYRLAVDLYIMGFFLLNLVLYSLMFIYSPQNPETVSAFSNWEFLHIISILGVLCAFTRLYEILCYLLLILVDPNYSPDHLMRSLLNILWHFVEVAVAFGIFYLACSNWSHDHFGTDKKVYALNLDWVNSLYFSIITLTTVGYGDITPQTRLGKALVICEVLIGLFLIAVVIQRAMSSRGRQTD